MPTILTHLDDVAATAGSVTAWRALRKAGVIRSASVMVPCPYYPMARDDWQAEPAQDTGIHITLTSEWAAYRWRPMIGPKGGLTDDDGFFHQRPNAVIENADPAAVADEIEAQIDRVLRDGLRPTHLDAHMGTALLPPFVGALMAAGKRHGLPVLVCRDLSPLIRGVGISGIDAGFLAEVVAEARREGWPVFDSFVIGFCADGVQIGDHVRGLLRDRAVGQSYYAMHADSAEALGVFAPHHQRPRRLEYEYFSDPTSAAPFEALGLTITGWRELTGASA